MGVGNLEAVELGLRQALLKDGRQLLENLLDEFSVDLPEGQSQPGEKCHPDRSKEVQTLFGPVRIRRDYFYRAARRTGTPPAG